jgi:hypothetical protein
MEYRKIIIVNYYGKMPVYATYFFDSCKRNASYKFVVFNDCYEDFVDGNIHFVKSNLQDFNSRATKSLGINVDIDRGFKICDFRPAYGIIYQELIHGFDFWGFCDIDIILGSLNDFLTDDLLTTLDVYSSKPKWNSGSFSLYRNTEVVNNLFRLTDDWKIIFLANKYYGFDECLQRWEGKPIRVADRTTEMLSIYDLIHSVDKIRACYADSVVEWPKDIRKLKWNNGKWLNTVTSEEFMYLHLLLMKNSWRFYQPKLHFTKEVFVTGLGLSDGDHTQFTPNAMVWRLKRVVYCTVGFVRNWRRKLIS